MKTVIAVLVAIIVVGGGWYWYTYMMPAAETPSTNTTTNNNAGGTDNTSGGTNGGVNVTINATTTVGDTTPTSATVTYTAAGGFSPSAVTIKKGGIVTWVNKDTGAMWVASANHPTHTVYSGTTLQQHCDTQSNDSFDQCENGTTYSFQFDKLGKWNYHNHSNASKFASVTVVE